MPSGISVQELKQMTALRMAHAQGHVRVVSPFQQYGEGRVVGGVVMLGLCRVQVEVWACVC